MSQHFLIFGTKQPMKVLFYYIILEKQRSFLTYCSKLFTSNFSCCNGLSITVNGTCNAWFWLSSFCIKVSLQRFGTGRRLDKSRKSCRPLDCWAFKIWKNKIKQNIFTYVQVCNAYLFLINWGFQSTFQIFTQALQKPSVIIQSFYFCF